MIVNGISGAVVTQHLQLQLEHVKVIDLKFLNDESLLVLVSLQGEPMNISNHPSETLIES
jgi:hypothetical protein